MLEPANLGNLLDFLSGYILVGKKMIQDLRDDQKLPSLNGQDVAVSVNSEGTFINGAKILSRDRQGTNGVIHLLDKTYTD